MLLSEFVAGDRAEGLGLVFDGPDYMPRQGISRISLVAVAAEGELDQDLLDTVIAYKTAGIDVALDVGADLGLPASAVLAVAMPLNVDLRLMSADGDEERYLDLVADFASCLPTHPGYAKTISPVSQALGILIRERLAAIEESDDVSAPEVDGVGGRRVLDAVSRGFSTALGGHEAFGEYLDLHVAAIYEDGRRRLAAYAKGTAPAA